jgi:hypothetical protein
LLKVRLGGEGFLLGCRDAIHGGFHILNGEGLVFGNPIWRGCEMGFRDLHVLALLVWLCLGHIKVGAQEAAPDIPTPVPPSSAPVNSTVLGQWSVNLTSPETTIITSSNGFFSFDLLLTNLSKSSCVAAVRHIPSETAVWVANYNDSNSTNPVQVSLCNISIPFFVKCRFRSVMWTSMCGQI